MSIESVREQITKDGLSLTIIECETSSATVELAAKALNVSPGQIAKTMVLCLKNNNILILARGNVKIDNKKYRDKFGEKPRMVQSDMLLEITGHPVGGVCPFGLKNKLHVYIDISLREYEYVYPAAGAPNAVIKIAVSQLAEFTHGEWVDVCYEPAI